MNVAERVRAGREARDAGYDYAEAFNEDDDSWAAPVSLTRSHKREPYPIERLPGIVADAIAEVQGYVQSPVAMVAMSSLTAMATAVQSHYDVARDSSLSGPASLFALTLGESGERKTSSDGYFNRPILEFERERRAAALADLKEYKSAKRAHEAMVSGHVDAIRKLTREGKPTDEREKALAKLEQEAPVRPKVPQLVLMDATPEGLLTALSDGWPSAIVASDEGGLILGGHAMGRETIMRNLAQLNVLWDGRSITVSRKTSDSFTAEGVRLSMSLQVQPATLIEFMAKNGGLSRGSGFWARFLLSDPVSTQGTRPYREPLGAWPALSKFQRRLREILDWEMELTENGQLDPRTLEMSEEGKRAWVHWHDATEAMLAAGGEFESIRDIASKAAENVARVAALFEVISCRGRPISISEESVRSAGYVVEWHLSESRRFFSEIAISDENRRTADLDEWLIERCRQQSVDGITRRDIQQYGPSSTRSREKLDAALSDLQDKGHIKLVEGVRRKVWVYVNPLLIGALRPVERAA